jgi:predicted Zn-dependent protease with MMP-like domain
MTAHWTTLLEIAGDEVRQTLHQLPPHLRTRACSLPCVYEDRPSPELQEDGTPHDTLGLFVGEEWAETGSTLTPLPAQIILFLENLWEFAGKDEEVYRDEVRITFLHELGHYLGLDEIDLDDRGLS